MTNNKPSAFLSYARFDDSHNRKSIQWLCNRLTGEVRELTGVPFKMFIDTEDIRYGEMWDRTIQEALESALFLIVIMTPSYFKSDNCKKEYDLFRKLEKIQKRSDLILPVYYVSVEEIDKERIPPKNKWLDDLVHRQYIDFRSLRFENRTSKGMHKKIVELAGRVSELLKSLNLQSESNSFENEDKIISMAPSSMSKEFPEYIEHTYLRLSQTQKCILEIMYKLHKSEISVDALYATIVNRYGPDLVLGSAELYFRIKDLVYKGFLIMKPVGHKTTQVISLAEVDKVLRDNQLIKT